MSTENTETNVELNDDDLDSFSADFFSRKTVDAEPANSGEDETDDDNRDAPNDEDTQENDETDTLATDDDNDETDEVEEDEDSEEADESEEEETPKQPKKKSRFQERIDELTAKARDAERRVQELEAKLNSQPKKNEETETPAQESAGPSPDDKNEDGTDKYPLGEFDPNYVRDLTKFTLQQEREALRAEEQKAQEQKQYEAERAALSESWNEKLGPAKERYPDFDEKGQQLVDTFSGIDQAYGEYLSATLMSMDYGPDVLYYLANNPDEANKIVTSGPTKATIALGRLEAKFVEAEAEKTKAKPKVSKAPPPPKDQLKGSAAVTPFDVDDLDALSRELFKKK